MGLLDHPMPKYKEKKIEPGTDTRNDYTGKISFLPHNLQGWNVSTELMNKFERAKLLETQ